MEALLERSYTMDQFQSQMAGMVKSARTANRQRKAKEVRNSARSYAMNKTAADAIVDTAHNQPSFGIAGVLALSDQAGFTRAVNAILKRAEQGQAIVMAGDTCIVRDEELLCEIAYRGLSS